MKRLLDLRFVIGLFFSTVGAVLIVAALAARSIGAESALAAGFTGSSINLTSGGFMGAFGVAMILLSLFAEDQ
jgi:hypothetical protein